MARALRLTFNDARYHITSLGNRREYIIYSDSDKNVVIDKVM